MKIKNPTKFTTKVSRIAVSESVPSLFAGLGATGIITVTIIMTTGVRYETGVEETNTNYSPRTVSWNV